MGMSFSICELQTISMVCCRDRLDTYSSFPRAAWERCFGAARLDCVPRGALEQVKFHAVTDSKWHPADGGVCQIHRNKAVIQQYKIRATALVVNSNQSDYLQS
jgi:hypothetical protein